MKSSLFIKFFFAILLVISSILIIYGVVNIQYQKDSNIKMMKAQASIVSKTLLLANVEAVLSNENAIIIENSLEFLRENKLIKYLIFNKRNEDTILIKENKWSLLMGMDPIYKSLQDDDSMFYIFKGSLHDKKVFHYTYPIKISSFNWGWVHIGFSLDEYNKNQEDIYDNFIYVTFVSFLLAVVFTFIFTRWMLKPILLLTIRTKDIIHGEYKEIPESNRTDEIDELTHNFNSMVRHLKKTQKDVLRSQRELETKVKVRTKELKELNKSLDIKVQEEVEKRQSQEKYLYEQSKLAQMGEMLNNIAHQWRQPLSVITTATSGVKLKKDLKILEDNEFDETYKLVMDNANYLTKTIDTFSKYTEDEYNIEHIDLNEVINDIVILNRDNFMKNHINIRLSLPEDKVDIETIPNSLSHVIFSILTNANNVLAKNKTLNEKCICISVYKNSGFYYIEVADNGGGIDKSIIDKVFEPYFTTKYNSKGIGMGLYLSYDIIVNQLNGEIDVRNGDEGAIFTIKLPITMNQ